MPTFAENLRQLRKSRGYSQDRFAKMIGSNQVTLSSWEVGYRMPSLATIQEIADTFNVPLSSLISIQDSGMDDDYVKEIAEMLQHDPKIRLLFDRAKYLSRSDLDVVLGVIDAITKERVRNA